MWKRIALIWVLVKSDARMLWSALRHPLSPTWLKWGVAGIALYLVSPIDFIPDFIPFIGVMDDIVLVPMAIAWLLKKLPAHVREDIQRRNSAGT